MNSMTTKEFVGAELEQAYAKVMGWRIVGGLNDGGKDLATGIPVMPFVQAKSSIPLTMDFLRKSAKRRRFIPICLGDPGKPDEVLTSLKQFGAWIGYEIPGRERFSKEIQALRRAL